jgi:tRNA A-37 threonylcarbamoyl transferase component Bud32
MTEGKIGRYTIVSELKRGGMAAVYRAYDPRFEREVAVKVLPKELLFDPQFRMRFEREAKALAAMEHAAIVPVYDFGEEDGQMYLVMRYMPYGSLYDRLRQGTLSLEDATRIITHIAPALDEAHRRGMIHRDIKPANILFDQRDEPHITDFGVVKLIDVRTTNTGQSSIGTPAYMSPEQARGEAGLDGRSDIYSLGAVLFEMLTGKIPFEADSLAGQLVRRITDPVPNILELRPDLPADLQHVIDRALAKRPHARYATTIEMAQALQRVLAGEPAIVGATQSDQAESAAGKGGERAKPGWPRRSPQRYETPTIVPAVPARRWPTVISSLGVATILIALVTLGVFRMLDGQGFGGLPPENTPQVVLAAGGPVGSVTPFLPAIGTVVEMRGVVQLQRPGQGAQLLVTGDALPLGEPLRLWTTNGMARIQLMDGSLLVLAENTLVTVQAAEKDEETDPTSGQYELTLEQGRLLVKTAQFTVHSDPHDYQLELTYAVAGVIYDPALDLFEVDCLEGNCLIAGQPPVELEGGSRANFTRGQLIARDEANYPPWIELGGSDVPTPTPLPTATITETPTPTATDEDQPPAPADTTAAGPPPAPTNTQRPPQPVPTATNPPPPTNTSVPAPTNTSAPPTNTTAPPSPTSGSSNEG